MNYLDLDSVQPESNFVLKLNGREHKLRETTIADFIENTKAVEKLGLNTSAVEEMELTIGMIRRSFPTLPEDELRSLTFTQLQAIVDYARQANGEVVEKDDAKGEGAEGNAEAASS